MRRQEQQLGDSNERWVADHEGRADEGGSDGRGAPARLQAPCGRQREAAAATHGRLAERLAVVAQGRLARMPAVAAQGRSARGGSPQGFKANHNSDHNCWLFHTLTKCKRLDTLGKIPPRTQHHRAQTPW
ncbi:hypothetical protein TRIUR3_31721 [Triticum urartu]|uniref:Uncharacterized protein n=1 Tax=Triticum urartu TaxID=4572 RepID=M8A6S0_TRIUA|nr:hypothetical protein TRIUR3_31721 [Triticum urartu]